MDGMRQSGSGAVALGLMHEKIILKFLVWGISFEHKFHDQSVDQYPRSPFWPKWFRNLPSISASHTMKRGSDDAAQPDDREKRVCANSTHWWCSVCGRSCTRSHRWHSYHTSRAADGAGGTIDVTTYCCHDCFYRWWITQGKQQKQTGMDIG